MKKYPLLKVLLPLTVIPLLYHYRIIFFRQSFFSDDLMQYFFPFKAFAKQAFWQGRVPLWSDGIYSGSPFLAMSMTYFYPFNILFRVMSFPRALSWFIALHSWLAGLFMYLYLRNLKLKQPACLIGSILFLFNGFVFREVIHPDILSSYVYLPLIFYFIDSVIKETSTLSVCGLALSFGVSILAGNPQIIYGISLLAITYLIFRLSLSRGGKLKSVLLLLALGFALGTVLSFCQFLPTYELTRFSARSGGVSYDYATQFSLSPSSLTAYFLPRLPYVFKKYFGLGWEGYIGITPFLFLLFLPRRREVYYFAGLASLVLLVTLGKYSPFGLHKLIYTIIPGFNSFRTPFRYVYLYLFCLITLVAMGVDNLSRRPVFSVRRQRAYRFILTFLLLFMGIVGLVSLLIGGQLRDAVLTNTIWVVVSGTSCLFYFKKRLGYQRLIAIAALVMIADLFLIFNFGNWPPVGPDKIFAFETIAPSLKPLAERKFPPRVLIAGTIPLRETIMPPGNRPDRFPDNFGLIFNLSHLKGYHHLASTSYLEFIRDVPSNLLLPLTSTDLILSANRMPLPLLQRNEEAKFNVYRNPASFPRAFIAYNWQYLVFESGFIPKFISKATELNRTAIISTSEVLPAQAFIDKQIEPAEITMFEDEKITVKAKLDKPGILVLNETFFPGWRVFSAGQELPIMRTNGIFRGIYLTPGEHEVTFVYEPFSYKLGQIWSTIALAAIGGLLITSLVKKTT